MSAALLLNHDAELRNSIGVRSAHWPLEFVGGAYKKNGWHVEGLVLKMLSKPAVELPLSDSGRFTSEVKPVETFELEL